ncbi:M14 family metallopeptidase [Alkalihalobacillus sp. LMS39]|uniref:M14 family metallopeptidase n=1 Tax=Alkalihalobacillus sp. LMS39 TaxID=2924032 RepID=UPI001FB33E63|nr:M14 family metallopeptidase [Alkalihalobacillus sp. LMS39]UOE92394.1 M14 family metallopeptidase [Alkalihalobacillus sp. LMS39]
MKTYVVKQGDTVAKVALQHGVRPIDLLLFNPSIENESSYITPNDILNIPERKGERITEHRFLCKTEYGPTDVERDVKMIKSSYHHIIFPSVIGHSVMGKPLYQFQIGDGPKKIFYSGGWHANEWLTSKFLMAFLFELADHYDRDENWEGYNVKDILNEVTLIIVPMVNPDGIELVHQGIYKTHPFYEDVLHINKGALRFEHWSSNIRGVDLNHQWPAGWEIEAEESPQHPWPRHYSGTAPLTEPEAVAIYDLTMKYEFAHVLAFHSQGQVIYWGYRNLEPKESKDMVTKLSLASSYVPVHTADSDGGYKDWFIQETGRAGFTIEVGVGTNPLPFSAFSEIWANNVCLALEGLQL